MKSRNTTEHGMSMIRLFAEEALALVGLGLFILGTALAVVLIGG